jgi:glycosyltransferase involved in cell wall biosynthesis
MAMGVPVVTSSAAAAGVDAEAERHFLVADGAEATAAAVLRLLDDPHERARLAASGRARMLSHHAWPRAMQRLDTLIDACVRTARRPRARALETAA